MSESRQPLLQGGPASQGPPPAAAASRRGLASRGGRQGSQRRPIPPNRAPPRRGAPVPQGGQRKPPPKPPKPAAAKKPPSVQWKRVKSTAFIFLALMGMQVIATTAFCMSVKWPMSLISCTRETPITVDAYGNFRCHGNCTPLTNVIILDIFLTNVGLTIFWYLGNGWLTRFGNELKDEEKEGKDHQAALDARDIAAGRPQATKDPNHHDPKHSWEWNQALKGWQERRRLHNERQNKGRFTRAVAFYALYFVIGVADMYAVMFISPRNWTPQVGGTYPYLLSELRGAFDFTVSGFYSVIIIVQFSLEVGLFGLAALSVRWPRRALIREREKLQHEVTVNRLKHATQAEMVVSDEHPGLIKKTCLLVACHRSTQTKDRKKTFTNTIKSALAVFPANAIFVCDNGPWRNPVDRTQEVCDKLSRQYYPDGSQRIQYLYIPEGNKSHAMYWATEYWIPELVRRGESVNFEYAIVMDDDVPLPQDMHVPINALNRNKDVKSVAYVIKAATEDGSINQLVQLQDLEYKLAGFVKQFQWQFGSTLCCHGAIGLWRRDVLGKKILWDHDTMFHGEDLYMGLLLHRMRKNYAIMVSAGAVVPTFAPGKLLMLFRQRVTSWDLCAQRKFSTQVKEFLLGWTNARTWILKPFMLQEIVNVLLDWIRVFLVVGLAHRNPVGLLLLFIIFYGLLYMETAVFNWVVLKDRPDLRVTPRTVLLFPFYRTLCLSFRLFALMWNIVHYSSWRPKAEKISEREETVQDLPPVPSVASPDWMTIWRENSTENDQESRLQVFADSLVKPLGIEQPAERRRVQCMVQAHLLYRKLLAENSRVNFPGCLRQAAAATEDASAMLATSMESLRMRIEAKLQELVGPQWGSFEKQLKTKLRRWMKLEDHSLFYHQLMQEQRVANVPFILRSNHHVLSSIRELIFATRYPARHDKVLDVKQSVAAVMDLVEMQLHADTEFETRTQTMEAMLAQLEEVQRVIQERQYDRMARAQRTLGKIRVRVQQVPVADSFRHHVLSLVDEYAAALQRAQQVSAGEAK